MTPGDQELDVAPAGPRALLYALGGGLGHATRMLALGRRLVRAGARVHLLVGSPLAAAVPLEEELGPDGEVTRLDPAAGAPALREAVAALVRGASWDAVVVDAFPRGLLGELPPLLAASDALRVWVQRDLAPRYVAWGDLRAAARGFQLVLRAGEGVPGARGARTRATAPWLVRDRHELLPAAAARLALEADPARPLVVVAGAGTAEEVAAASLLAARLEERLGDAATVRFLAPPGAPAPGMRARWVWPLLAHLPGVDLLVGAGGYHTVHEARATRTPLLALPRPRLYDRQAQRLRPDERARGEAELLERAAALLAPRRAPVPEFTSGAADGAAAIFETLARAHALAPQEA